MFDLFKDIDFAELCITSTAQVKKGSNNEIKILTKRAIGDKCPVCWKISTEKCIRHQLKNK